MSQKRLQFAGVVWVWVEGGDSSVVYWLRPISWIIQWLGGHSAGLLLVGMKKAATKGCHLTEKQRSFRMGARD